MAKHQVIEEDTHLIRTVTVTDLDDGSISFDVEEQQYREDACPMCGGARARDLGRTLGV